MKRGHKRIHFILSVFTALAYCLCFLDSNLAQEIVEMQEDVKYLKQNDELNINLHKSIRDTQEKLNARICDLENISLTLQSDDTDNASPYSKLLKEKSSNGNNYFHVPASVIKFYLYFLFVRM